MLGEGIADRGAGAGKPRRRPSLGEARVCCGSVCGHVMRRRTLGVEGGVGGGASPADGSDGDSRPRPGGNGRRRHGGRLCVPYVCACVRKR